jgi:hypothetical protein
VYHSRLWAPLGLHSLQAVEGPSPGDATTSGSSRAAFKCSSHSERRRPHATVTALAASTETFSGRAATSYGSEGWGRRPRLASSSLESRENVGYVPYHCVQHWDHWTKLAEPYITDKTNIKFYIGIRPGGTHEYAEYQVTCTRTAAGSEVVNDRGRLPLRPWDSRVGDTVSECIDPVRKRCALRDDHQQMKLPVLIYIREPYQLGERMQFSLPHSFIRLKRFKPINICG